MIFIFGIYGLSIFLFSPFLLSFIHYAGIEEVSAPSLRTIGTILLTGFFGSVIANLLWSIAVISLNPIVVSIGVSMQIPLATGADALLFKEHQFSTLYLIGSFMVVVSVVAVSFDYEDKPGPVLLSGVPSYEKIQLDDLLDETPDMANGYSSILVTDSTSKRFGSMAMPPSSPIVQTTTTTTTTEKDDLMIGSLAR